MLTDFGQFLTHDIIQTPDLAGSGPDPCDCVRTDVCDYVFPRKDPVIPWFCFFIVKSVGRIGRSGNDNLIEDSKDSEDVHRPESSGQLYLGRNDR